jgi:hypothetical protein
MSALVLSFAQETRRRVDWSAQELAEFYRVESALLQAGLKVETERGISDEGEPWFAFCRAEDGDVIVHIARVNNEYILAGPTYQGVAHGRDIRSLVGDLVARHPLVRIDSRQRGNSNIFMHPAALLIAVVATAFLKSGEAHAMSDQAPTPASAKNSWVFFSGLRSGPEVDTTAASISFDAAHAAVIMSAVLSFLAPQDGSPAIAPVPHEAASLPSIGGLAPAPAAGLGLHSVSLANPGPSDQAVMASDSPLSPSIEQPSSHALDVSSTLSILAVLSDIAKSPPPTAPVLLDGQFHAADVLLPGFSGLEHVSANPVQSGISEKAALVVALSASDAGLPKVLAATVLVGDDLVAQLGPDQFSHLVKLPDMLQATLQSSQHEAIDPSQLPAGINVSHIPDVGGSQNANTGGTAAPAVDATATAPHATINFEAAIHAFMAETPGYKMVTTASDVVFYDSYTLSHNFNAIKSVTWDFPDGSTLSLVGTAAAVHDAAVHAGIA